MKTDSIQRLRDNVPAELRTHNHFVAYRLEKSREPGDKAKKVPYNPVKGTKASVNEKDTLGGFDDALSALEHGIAICSTAKHTFNGIGCVLYGKEGIVVIDIDHCVKNGVLNDYALRLIALFNSYTEFSPSGTGIHIFISAKKSLDFCKHRYLNKIDEVEVYQHLRFITLTGDHISSTPKTIEDRQLELDRLTAEVMAEKQSRQKKQRVSAGNSGQRDFLPQPDDIVIATLKRDPKLRKIWNGEDGMNASDGDMALAGALARLTGCDREQMIRIMEGSPRYRDKFHRNARAGETYLEGTIDQAIDHCDRVHDYGSQSDAIMRQFSEFGYIFSQSELDDRVYVSGQPITDGQKAMILTQMADVGFRQENVVTRVMRSAAYQNKFHPVKDILEALPSWDGFDNIGQLASYITDSNPSITYADGSVRSWTHVVLLRFLIGAIAKLYEREQNFVLVFSGIQGLGKSTFFAWLCALFVGFYHEGQLDPDGRETPRRLANTYLWDTQELMRSTRKAAVEAMKAILTQIEVTFRNPYDTYDTTKPVMASFIGSVNPDNKGFLGDTTGNRRYVIVDLVAFDHGYSIQCSNTGVWAQALHLYRSGESWRLSPEEVAVQNAINEGHMVEDQLDMIMPAYFDIDVNNPELQIAPVRIAELLRSAGYANTLDKCSKDASIWLRQHGHKKVGKPLTWRGIAERYSYPAQITAQDGTRFVKTPYAH